MNDDDDTSDGHTGDPSTCNQGPDGGHYECARCAETAATARAEARGYQRAVDDIAGWLESRAEQYPLDVFPPPGETIRKGEVPTQDAYSAHTARHFAIVWSSLIRCGEHEQSGAGEAQDGE